MTSIVKLQVFSGAKDEGPLCYLLQIDGDYILLDCGWDERFDTKYIEELKPFIPKISAVLISHPDILHLGALPYLVGKCGLQAPVYATVPVFKMGQMFIYDWIYSHKDVEEFTHFSLEDLDLAVERVEQVKYNQTVVLKGDSGVHFTALPAGHMLGGSIWRICRVTGEDIIYSVDFNHKKERHLNGCSFENFNRPHLLITGAHHISLPQMRRKDRDELLVNKILRIVRQRGDCMIVIDTAGRVLEIAHLLDQLWSNTDAGLSTYNLVMLSHVASSVVQFAKSQLEWMNEKLYRFDSSRANPFSLRNVHLCHSHEDLMKVRSPRVVLCSNLDMESGFSRELFLEWCTDSRNGVILTGRPSNFTLAAKLVNLAESAVDGKLNVEERFLNLTVKKRQPLDGEELLEYRRRKAERDAEETRQKMERARRQAHTMTDESDDSDEEDMMINNQKTGLDQKEDYNSDVHCFDIMAKWDNQQKQSFFKSTKKSFPIYPYLEEKVRWDDYGEIIKLEEYTIAPIKDIVLKKGKDDQVIVKKESEEDMENDYNEQDEENIEVEEMPTKCVEFKYRVEVLCRVEFIEYEGISDGESTKKLLAGLQPRQIIIVHGSIQDTRELFAYFNDHGIAQGKIEAPIVGQLVDASVESFIFQVALSDALLADIQFKEVQDGNGLAWIDARVVEKEAIKGLSALSLNDTQPSSSNPKVIELDNDEEPMEQSGDVDEQSNIKDRLRGNLILDILPNRQIPCHDAVFVNDPKLTDFKNTLAEKGYKAEFLSGTLLINGGACSIRRCETGHFLLEGALSKEYYKLRHLFYDQFAVL